MFRQNRGDPVFQFQQLRKFYAEIGLTIGVNMPKYFCFTSDFSAQHTRFIPYTFHLLTAMYIQYTIWCTIVNTSVRRSWDSRVSMAWKRKCLMWTAALSILFFSPSYLFPRVTISIFFYYWLRPEKDGFSVENLPERLLHRQWCSTPRERPLQPTVDLIVLLLFTAKIT